jgi:hypothetical protein
VLVETHLITPPSRSLASRAGPHNTEAPIMRHISRQNQPQLFAEVIESVITRDHIAAGGVVGTA